MTFQRNLKLEKEDSSKTIGIQPPIHPCNHPSIHPSIYLSAYLSEHMTSHHETIIFSDHSSTGGRDSLQFLEEDHLFLLNKLSVAPLLAAVILAVVTVLAVLAGLQTMQLCPHAVIQTWKVICCHIVTKIFSLTC